MFIQEFMGSGGIIFALIYVVVGLYLLNVPFDFIAIPEAVQEFENWIVFVGCVLVIIGAVNHFRNSSRVAEERLLSYRR